MKNLLIICSILFSFVVNAQQGYPVPPKSENRLFYIQHNDNKNTFVYDALFSSKGILDDDNPEERRLGISIGKEFLSKCNELWVFGEHISQGMFEEIEFAKGIGIPIKRIMKLDIEIKEEYFSDPEPDYTVEEDNNNIEE